jgi:ATP-dependent exoDNAse (exonuclease V) alpha subunit
MTQDEALQILKTGASVFLTGEPGSGKSHVAARYVSYLRREAVAVSITASTGIAAAQLGGTTVHAWSGIGTRSQITRADLDAISKNRRVTDRIKKARVLIIDEVSMLSGQTLLAVAGVCQFVRKSNAPFGGLQIVLVGDFFQLPPIMRRDERGGPETESQDEADNSPFAYASRAWRDLSPSVCYLTEQHRQTDAEFSSLLAAIRSNRCGKPDLNLLASRRLTQDGLPRSVTRLFTHNMDVDRINQAELVKLPGDVKSFEMSSTGDKLLAEGLKRGCLSPERLDLKQGAVVMFTKNDPEGRYVNGTLGVVSGFDREDGNPIVLTKSGSAVFTKRAEWKVAEDETVRAGIEQIPLRLAWAITVHKSQGMSLDAAVIDLSHAFEYGQGYVALSRVRSLSGLHLLGWNERALRVHPQALEKDADFRRASHAEGERLANARTEAAARQAAFIQGTKGAQPAQTGSPAATAAGSGNAYKKWTEAEDADVSARYKRGESVKAIAAVLGRQEGGVRSRLVKLGLILK